ncbi:MAG: DUF1307 domain-containing protein [Suipraeoptans sp.]
MNKRKLVVALLLTILTLSGVVTGCGSNNESNSESNSESDGDKEQDSKAEAEIQSATYKISQAGFELEIVLNAQDDIINKIIQSISISYEDNTEEEIATIEESISAKNEIYDNMDGITYTSEIKDKTLTERFEIDVTEENISEIISNSLLPITVSEDTDVLSFKALGEELENTGWTAE